MEGAPLLSEEPFKKKENGENLESRQLQVLQGLSKEPDESKQIISTQPCSGWKKIGEGKKRNLAVRGAGKASAFGTVFLGEERTNVTARLRQ